jgi:hypothetical protein
MIRVLLPDLSVIYPLCVANMATPGAVSARIDSAETLWELPLPILYPELLEGILDGGHRSGTFLQHPIHWEYNHEQKHHGRIPGMIPDSPGDSSQQQENQGSPLP